MLLKVAPPFCFSPEIDFEEKAKRVTQFPQLESKHNVDQNASSNVNI